MIGACKFVEAGRSSMMHDFMVCCLHEYNCMTTWEEALHTCYCSGI